MIGSYHTPQNSKDIKLCVEESIISKNIKTNRTFPWSKEHRMKIIIAHCVFKHNVDSKLESKNFLI